MADCWNGGGTRGARDAGARPHLSVSSKPGGAGPRTALRPPPLAVAPRFGVTAQPAHRRESRTGDTCEA